jgi:hypothetical protein
VSSVNLVTFSDIHGRKGEVLFFYFVSATTRDHITLSSSSSSSPPPYHHRPINVPNAVAQVFLIDYTLKE